MNMKQIPESLLRLVGEDSDAAVMLQTGYRNEIGERTHVGMHMLLNYLEEQNKAGFLSYLREKREEAKAKQAEQGE